MKRKGMLFMMLAVVAMVTFCASLSFAALKSAARLKFNKDKTFKIVQFTDTQDDQEIDPRTVQLIEAVLDAEKPDLVVFTGDNIRSGPLTAEDVKTAIDSVVAPVDSRAIPWLITFGNHDEDHTTSTGMDKAAQLEYYMSYAYNINQVGPVNVEGVGNMQVIIRASKSSTPMFNIWALDSGEYSEDTIGEQAISADGLPGWAWIKPDQIAWYLGRSAKLESLFGKKLPSLMFFHIPLWEHKFMWDNKDNHAVTGEKNEDVCPGPFNSGLFTALLARGDVKGVFVGHDHVNNYVGNYFGITLGYSANTGFGTYGLGGTENDRLRGARVFELNENTPETFTTRMVYATDYAIQ